MMTFIFWNSKKASADLVAELAADHRADVLMLAETKLSSREVLDAIARIDGASFSKDNSPARVALYTRFSTKDCVFLEQDLPLMSMRRIKTQQEDLLLVMAHLRSKMNTSPEGQAALIPRYANEIRRIEDKIGHRRTVLVGDLNMDPYEPGIVQVTGFHAIPSHRIATERGTGAHRGEREVDGASYPYFYNPMWNCFGDERFGPGGTFFATRLIRLLIFGTSSIKFWFDLLLCRASAIRTCKS